MNKESQDFRQITAETAGKDLLGALVTEIKFGINTGNLPELFSAAAGQESKTVLVVVAGAEEYTQGMDEVRGEDDERNIDLGHEYHDNDGGGMDDKNVEDAEEVKGLPSPDQVKPTEEELDQAFEDGFKAAEEGKPQSDCPIIRSELVIEWAKGWKAWHAEQSNDKDAA